MAAISVDRAVWYLVEDIEIDLPRISAFYDRLDFPGKPPFGDCRIHITELGYLDKVGGALARQQLARVPRPAPDDRFWKKRALVDGVHLLERRDAHLLDPLAPEVDILLFLGSSAYADDYSRLVPALGQQLAAYARGQDTYPTASAAEEKLRTKLWAQEQAALKKLRHDGFIEIAASGAASAVGGAVLSAAALFAGPLSDFARGVAIEAVGGAVETASESNAQQKERWKTGHQVLDHALAREAAPEFQPVGQALEQDAIRCQPRTGAHLRAPIVVWSRPRRGINLANHRRRCLHRVSLTR